MREAVGKRRRYVLLLATLMVALVTAPLGRPSCCDPADQKACVSASCVSCIQAPAAIITLNSPALPRIVFAEFAYSQDKVSAYHSLGIERPPKEVLV